MRALSLTAPISNLLDFFRAFYAYRGYLVQSIARDLRKRYKRSVLGYLWSMLNPLFMMIILAVVFSNIMGRPAKEYSVFLLTGLLLWELFSSTIAQSLNSIRGNIKLIMQVSVPKFIFPLSIALSNLTSFLLSLVALLAVIAFTGAGFHLTMLALPLVLIPVFFFTMGLALLFTVSNVFFADTQHLSGLILRALYFLCPILYDRHRIPAWLVDWLVLNPLFGQIEFMRDLFIKGVLPDPVTYLINFGGSLLMLIFGLWIFRKSENKFIYFV
ncbi:MAG: ABC transporter permease [Deltaproteobacteria bacterium]|nr:ABC transporter permease [Deltaproteobacteria bacterium]